MSGKLRKREIYNDECLIDHVSELKPKFDRHEIETALNYLKMRGYLE